MIPLFEKEKFEKALKLIVPEPRIQNLEQGDYDSTAHVYAASGKLCVDPELTVVFIFVEVYVTYPGHKFTNSSPSEAHQIVSLSKGIGEDNTEEALLVDGTFYKTNAVIEDAHFTLAELYRLKCVELSSKADSEIHKLLEALYIDDISDFFESKELAGDYPPTETLHELL